MDYYSARELARARNDPDIERYKDCVEEYHEDGDGSIGESGDGVAADCDIDSDLNAEADDPARSSNQPNMHGTIPHFDTAEMDRILAETAKVKPARGESVSTIPRAEEKLPTRVALLRDDWAASDWTDPLPDMQQNLSLHARPSLRDTSRFFRLNKKQHKMFVGAGKCLLSSLTTERTQPEDQMIGFLGGQPGAGKSLVIKALQSLAINWQCSEAISTVAYQGVAAQAADGQTLHKFFGWSIHAKKKETNLRNGTERTICKVEDVDY
ncbi:hypothetical protein DVH05_013311 [Phytophthora capsici]|nr:hypothetical protein DVH05_013311 [Phytophthora capsici]